MQWKATEWGFEWWSMSWQMGKLIYSFVTGSQWSDSLKYCKEWKFHRQDFLKKKKSIHFHPSNELRSHNFCWEQCCQKLKIDEDSALPLTNKVWENAKVGEKVNSKNQGSWWMFLSHLLQNFHFPKFSINLKFEGKSYKTIKKLVTLYTPINCRNFISGCMYRTIFSIQLWLANFSALLSWHGRSDDAMYIKHIFTAVCHVKNVTSIKISELKKKVLFISYKDRPNISWLPIVAEEFLKTARRKRKVQHLFTFRSHTQWVHLCHDLFLLLLTVSKCELLLQRQCFLYTSAQPTNTPENWSLFSSIYKAAVTYPVATYIIMNWGLFSG